MVARLRATPRALSLGFCACCVLALSTGCLLDPMRALSLVRLCSPSRGVHVRFVLRQNRTAQRQGEGNVYELHGELAPPVLPRDVDCGACTAAVPDDVANDSSLTTLPPTLPANGAVVVDKPCVTL